MIQRAVDNGAFSDGTDGVGFESEITVSKENEQGGEEQLWETSVVT